MNIFYRYVLLNIIAVSLFAVGCATTQPSVDETQSTARPALTRQITVNYDSLKRPVANPIDSEVPYAYQRSIREGTRTPEGIPGKNYWTQQVDYQMDAEIMPEQKKLVASSTITYHNNSPDSLNAVVLELAQNVHAEGMPRKEITEITGGIQMDSVRMGGRAMQKITMQGQRGYYIDGTRMFITAPSPIAPNSTTTIELKWSFQIPEDGAGGRMGYSEDNLFFIAYWYPQVTVYDDVFGWFTDRFLLNAEFYHEFGDYEVNITAPEQWLVTSTGSFTNPEDVLAPNILKRYQQARQSDTKVSIIDSTDFGQFTRTSGSDKLTWSFSADNVRDFAFSVTSQSLWEGARTPVGDLDGDNQTDYSFVDAVYRLSAPKWSKAVEYAQHSISFFSEYTGLNYPWPHMTSVEGGGIIGGGMEFPMMTLIGAYNYQPQENLYYVIAHEFAHMWVPMIVSTNERRFAWIDEGTTTFNENQARKDYFEESGNPDLNEYNSYSRIAGTYLEGPIMRWSDFHYPGPAYGVASYPKPASGLTILRELLGEQTFNKAYQTFIDEWKYKHPYPWDMFNVFESVSGRELDWFWRSFYYETWILDQAVGQVSQTDSGTLITIRDLGQIPLPAQVKITLGNGETINRTVAVETWLNGATTAEIVVNRSAEVTKVEIDPDQSFPDVNRANNDWVR